MKIVRAVHLSGWSIFKQLKLEEYLLRTTNDNFLIFNHGIAERAIVMGFGAKPLDLLHVDAIRRDKVQVLRRFTGGGTVIVDPNTLFVSFIMNAADVPCQPYPREIMGWTETIYSPVFQANLPPSGEHYRLREHDYVIGEKKIGGNAQSIVKQRWIHHTSFLWDFRPSNMEYLKLPMKRPEYRSDRSHKDFLLPLHGQLPSKQGFLDDVQASLGKHYQVIQDESLEEACDDLDKVFEEYNSKLDETGHVFKPRTVIEEV